MMHKMQSKETMEKRLKLERQQTTINLRLTQTSETSQDTSTLRCSA